MNSWIVRKGEVWVGWVLGQEGEGMLEAWRAAGDEAGRFCQMVAGVAERGVIAVK